MTLSESTVTQNLQAFDASQRGIEAQVGELFSRYQEVYDRLALEFPRQYLSPRIASISLPDRTVLLTNDTVVSFDDLIDPDKATATRRQQLEEEIARRTHQRDNSELTELEVEFAAWDAALIEKVGRLLELRRRYPDKETFNRLMVGLAEASDQPVTAEIPTVA